MNRFEKSPDSYKWERERRRNKEEKRRKDREHWKNLSMEDKQRAIVSHVAREAFDEYEEMMEKVHKKG